MQHSYANKIYARHDGNRSWAAIQVTTASAICAVLDMLAHGKLPQKGLILQEQIPLAAFLENRFGKAYAVTTGIALAA